MQILRDAIEIQFDKHELDPPVPTFLLNQSPIGILLQEKDTY